MNPETNPKSTALNPLASDKTAEPGGNEPQLAGERLPEKFALSLPKELFDELKGQLRAKPEIIDAAARDEVKRRLQDSLSPEGLGAFFELTESALRNPSMPESKPMIFSAVQALLTLRTQSLLAIGEKIRSANTLPASLLAKLQQQLETASSAQEIIENASIPAAQNLIPEASQWPELSKRVLALVQIRRIAQALCQPGADIERTLKEISDRTVILPSLDSFAKDLCLKGSINDLELRVTENAWAAWNYQEEQPGLVPIPVNPLTAAEEVQQLKDMVSGVQRQADRMAVRTTLQLLGVYGRPVASFTSQTNEVLWERLESNLYLLNQREDLDLLIEALRDKRPSLKVAQSLAEQIPPLLDKKTPKTMVSEARRALKEASSRHSGSFPEAVRGIRKCSVLLGGTIFGRLLRLLSGKKE